MSITYNNNILYVDIYEDNVDFEKKLFSILDRYNIRIVDIKISGIVDKCYIKNFKDRFYLKYHQQLKIIYN